MATSYGNYNAAVDEGQMNLKMIKDMDFDDICKKQILDCLSIGNREPERFYNAVELLEKMMGRDVDLDNEDSEYNQTIKRIVTKAKSETQNEVSLSMAIAMGKFYELIKAIEKKIPKKVVLTIKRGDDEEVVENVQP